MELTAITKEQMENTLIQTDKLVRAAMHALQAIRAGTMTKDKETELEAAIWDTVSHICVTGETINS